MSKIYTLRIEKNITETLSDFEKKMSNDEKITNFKIVEGKLVIVTEKLEKKQNILLG